jgi:hypothetical protein
MKKRFLVLYDYGQGGAWAYLLANSREEIAMEYPQLLIYDQPPAFLGADVLDRIEKTMTIDIGNRENPFLRTLRRQ